jgi:ABC-type phosphate transport system auxiliary subunit
MGIKDFFTQDAKALEDRQAARFRHLYETRPWIWLTTAAAGCLVGIALLWVVINGKVALIAAAVAGWFCLMTALGLWRRRASR